MGNHWKKSTVRDGYGRAVAHDSVRRSGSGHEVIRQDRHSGRIVDHTVTDGRGRTYDRVSGRRR